jgi:hypothetical protein
VVLTFTGATATVSVANSGTVSGTGTITTSNSTDLILGSAQTFASSDVITIENSVYSNPVLDLTFNINEIPILEENYIRVVTTGGS